jgi:hypothetical protein
MHAPEQFVYYESMKRKLAITRLWVDFFLFLENKKHELEAPGMWKSGIPEEAR